MDETPKRKYHGGRPRDPGEPNVVRVVARISMTMAEKLTDIAAEHDKSVAWVIRELLTEALSRLIREEIDEIKEDYNLKEEEE